MTVRAGLGISLGCVFEDDPVFGLPCLCAAVHFVMGAIAAWDRVIIGNLERHALAASVIDVTGAYLAVANMASFAFQYAGAAPDPLQMRRAALSFMLLARVLFARREG